MQSPQHPPSGTITTRHLPHLLDTPTSPPTSERPDPNGQSQSEQQHSANLYPILLSLMQRLAQVPLGHPYIIEQGALHTPAVLLVPEEQCLNALQQIATSLHSLGVGNVVLTIALQAFNSIQCKPAVHHDEIIRIIQNLHDISTQSAQPAQPAQSAQPTQHTQTSQPPISVQKYPETQNERRNQSRQTHYQSLNHLFTTPQAEPEWILPGILPVGVSLLTGKAKTGTSSIALHIALAVAGHTPFLGSPITTPGRVLYLAPEESAQSMLARLQKINITRESTDSPSARRLSNITWFSTWPKLRDGGLADLEEFLMQYPQGNPHNEQDIAVQQQSVQQSITRTEQVRSSNSHRLRNFISGNPPANPANPANPVTPATRLIVIDPLTSLHPLPTMLPSYGKPRGGSPPTEEASAILTPLKHMAAQYGVAILLVHRVSSPRYSDSDDDLGNAVDLARESNCVIKLIRERDQNSLEMHVSVDGAFIQRLHLAFNEQSGQWLTLHKNTRPRKQ